MKIYTRLVIQISSGEILEEQSYEYQGNISECKGGSGGTSTKPYQFSPAENKLYGRTMDYFNTTMDQYNPSDLLNTYMGQSKGLSSNLEGLQSRNFQPQYSLLGEMSSQEGYRQAIRPYLDKAYQGIGYSGMPGGSYADENITNAINQGWFGNTQNILSGYNQLTGQEQANTSALSSLYGSQYDVANEPKTFIEALKQAVAGQSTTKSNTGGKGGFSLGL